MLSPDHQPFDALSSFCPLILSLLPPQPMQPPMILSLQALTRLVQGIHTIKCAQCCSVCIHSMDSWRHSPYPEGWRQYPTCVSLLLEIDQVRHHSSYVDLITASDVLKSFNTGNGSVKKKALVSMLMSHANDKKGTRAKVQVRDSSAALEVPGL